jgi:hypothetical protein
MSERYLYLLFTKFALDISLLLAHLKHSCELQARQTSQSGHVHHCVQTGSGVCPLLYQMATFALSSEVKRLCENGLWLPSGAEIKNLWPVASLNHKLRNAGLLLAEIELYDRGSGGNGRETWGNCAWFSFLSQSKHWVLKSSTVEE